MMLFRVMKEGGSYSYYVKYYMELKAEEIPVEIECLLDRASL